MARRAVGLRVPRKHPRVLSAVEVQAQAICRHHWDDSLPATALLFADDYPARAERAPRALAEQVMAQIEHPDNLARVESPAYRLVTLILIRAGRRVSDALRLPTTAWSPTPTGRPTCAATRRCRIDCGTRRRTSFGVGRVFTGCGQHECSMTSGAQLPIRRRSLLTGVGAAAVVLGGAAGCATGSAQFLPGPDRSGAPRVAGMHLQFGADAGREVVVSWHTTSAVSRPRVMLGTAEAGFGQTVAAETTTYRDAQSGTEVRIHHARLGGLAPDTDHVYAAVHDGATPELGTVRTAPAGRAPLRFTSFGDQGTPTLGKKGPGGYVNDNLGSPAAGDVTSAVERAAPLFHLVNGDLCYANLATDRVRTWSDWFADTGRSARHRPWMPAAGNHENEAGNGPVGYGAYQSYFAVPDAGAGDPLRGLWYAFTAGSVRVISLNNDDVAYQDGGNSYVRGYSGGAQQRWLEAELARTRADPGIDWIVVCMHQVVISTVDKFNGADRGVREAWGPLFDRWGVDLVVCGHEHHYERSHPVRGTLPTDTLTPNPVATGLDVIDTTAGTVHMVIGGGGTSSPSNQLFFDPPAARVITGVGPYDPATKKKTPIYVGEAAPWSAVRDRQHAYGFATFDVDPGRPGGTTSITVTYAAVTGPYGESTPVDRFTLTRPRGSA